MNVFLNQIIENPAHVEAFKREKDVFYQTSFFEIQNNSSKLKTHATLKTNIDLGCQTTN